jgi:NitT/TauT family transport system substrate-binding protein
LGCAPAAVNTVRIGYLLGDLHQLPFFVAQEKGYFKEEGINVVVVGPFDSGPAEMDALAANQLDMGYVGLSPAILAAARKVELSVVAGVNLEGSALAVAQYINSVAELKAKKVATPAPGSMQYIMMGMLLGNNKMSFSDLELFAGTIKPPDMAQTLQTGRLDGYFVWEPFVSKSIVSGAGKILAESKDIWPGHPCCVVVTRNDYSGINDKVVAAALRAHQKAVQFIGANPSEAKLIAQKWTKLDEAVVGAAFNRVKYTYSVNKDDVKRFVTEIIDLGAKGTIKPIITTGDVPDTEIFVNKVVDLKYLQR